MLNLFGVNVATVMDSEKRNKIQEVLAQNNIKYSVKTEYINQKKPHNAIDIVWLFQYYQLKNNKKQDKTKKNKDLTNKKTQQNRTRIQVKGGVREIVMIAIERRNGILEKLQEDKKVVVGELSQLYKVSEETIRRDLERLEKEGLCTKSYGGAVLNENNNVEMPFNVRKKSNATGKQKIAELIAGMVEDGEHILLDASTTAVYIAKALKSKSQE